MYVTQIVRSALRLACRGVWFKKTNFTALLHHIPIKPLTVNRSYQGRRFATPELKAFKQILAYLLPPLMIPKGKLSVKYVFGVSSKASDGDNLIKSFQESVAFRPDIGRWPV